MLLPNQLYIATIAEDAADLAEKYGVGIELDTFCTAANMDPESFTHWDAVTRPLLDASSRHIMHAPFAELCPAAIDPQIRQVVRARFEQAYRIATQHSINRMVVHAGFIPHVYFPEWFVVQSAAFWRDFLADKPQDFTLLIENVLEADPHLLKDIIIAIGDSRAKLCLDIGHAFLQPQHSLDTWIDTLAPYIAHVHLHNNHGDYDTHNSITDGKIPIISIVKKIQAVCSGATFTLEMQNAESSLEALLAPETESDHAEQALSLLKRIYGYDDFRDGQRDLIDAQLSGQDALGIMPTGSGKSICFQIPALLMDGITLVVSPLISLMKDQVTALNQNGVKAAYLNSSLTERQFDAAMRNAEAGVYKLIYVAPERLLTNRFLSFAKRSNISLVAVDEAHCISQWGQDFRPGYLDIPRFVSELDNRPPVSAFTATATAQVKKDIVRLLAMQNPVTVQTGFDRPNLYYEVQQPQKKANAVLSILQKYEGQSGIIYCATRKGVDEVCMLLQDHGISASRYHAGLGDEERRQSQDDFTFDRVQVIVATNAFGMGIDKSNVRFVIHYNMPKDLESYYQEAGRAGRDGENADCVLLYSGQDVRTQQYLIDLEDDESPIDPATRASIREGAYKRLREMQAYCQTQGCLRMYILQYFGEGNTVPCGNCSNCQSEATYMDATKVAAIILRCVRGTGERFGIGTIVDVLRGANNARVRQFNLHTKAGYGALAHLPAQTIKEVAEHLSVEGYLDIQQGKYPTAALGAHAQDVLENDAQVLIKLRGKAYHPAPKKARAAPKAKQNLSPTPADMDPALFEALRALRLRLATELGVPAFVVFTDAALRDMAAKKPTTLQAMLSVNGVGEAKARQFGQIFLEQIRQHEASE